MSDRQCHCVCGTGQKKEPKIITITICRHKHTPKKEDSYIFQPLATSSPTDVTSASEKSRQHRRTEEQEKIKSSDDNEKDSDKSLKSKNVSTGISSLEKDGTQYYSTQDQSGSAYETANESTMASFRTADGSNVNESTFNTAVQESTISDVTGNDTAETGYTADDSSKFSDTALEESELTGFESANDTTNQNDKTKDKRVMFLTDIAVNTMPFLDNLFWTKGATTKSMPNLSDTCGDQENCSIEVFVFDKHSKFCRYHLEGFNKHNSFFDGDKLFETLGRISLPVRCDDCNVNYSKSDKIAEIYSQLKETFTTNQDNKTNYENPFKTIDKFVKGKQFSGNLNNRTTEPLNIRLNKYITLGDDIYQRDFETTSKVDMEELYTRKSTNDRSVQYGGFYLRNNAGSKWYDIFLICLGLKDSEDTYNVDSISEEPTNDSSVLITKYLRI